MITNDHPLVSFNKGESLVASPASPRAVNAWLGGRPLTLRVAPAPAPVTVPTPVPIYSVSTPDISASVIRRAVAETDAPARSAAYRYGRIYAMDLLTIRPSQDQVSYETGKGIAVTLDQLANDILAGRWIHREAYNIVEMPVGATTFDNRRDTAGKLAVCRLLAPVIKHDRALPCLPETTMEETLYRQLFKPETNAVMMSYARPVNNHIVMTAYRLPHADEVDHRIRIEALQAFYERVKPRTPLALPPTIRPGSFGHGILLRMHARVLSERFTQIVEKAIKGEGPYPYGFTLTPRFSKS